MLKYQSARKPCVAMQQVFFMDNKKLSFQTFSHERKWRQLNASIDTSAY